LQAAHALALFIDGDEEAMGAVYNVQDTVRSGINTLHSSTSRLTIPRHTLGTIVSKYENYVVRIAVANLIREFMKGKFDRSLFWPDGTLAPSICGFPLADIGDAEWLANVVEFLGATNAPNTFLAE
jgi:hypothetical protein